MSLDSDFIADRGVEKKSDRLLGKRVGWGVSGGIGAVEVVKIIRELRRHGADVIAFFSPTVTDFVGELAVEWATGHKVISKPGAEVDHLENFDLVVVAPATLNTVVKASQGHADNSLLLLVASHLGANHRATSKKRPLIFVPTMNVKLSHHPAYSLAVEQLTAWGATFFESAVEEDRLKMPTPLQFTERVLEILL